MVRRAGVSVIVTMATIVVIALLLHPSGSSRQQNLLPGLHLGQEAPLFSLKSVDGTSLNLRSFHGRTVLVNFWSTTCAPCKVEIPELQRAFESLDSRKAVIIGVDAETDDVASVRGVARRFHVGYSLALDPLLSATIVAYHVAVLPSSVVIDPAGRLRMIHVGPMSFAQITRALSSTT